MTKPLEFNVETARHLDHTLKTWHDQETKWFFSIDNQNAQPVEFSFGVGMGVEERRKQAKKLAHEMLHHKLGEAACGEEPDREVDHSTRIRID